MPNDDLATEVNRLRKTLEPIQIDGVTHYVAETDLILDEDELWDLAARALEDAPVDDKRYLVVEVDEDGRPKLVSAKQFPLRYCIDRSTLSSDDYALAVSRMHTAASQWSEICNVSFQHDEHLDGRARIQPTDELFVVRGVEVMSPVAAAFFPWYEAKRRIVRLCTPYFSPTLGFDAVGVLRHELGHVLGFRHEHIRKEAAGSPYAREDTEDIKPLGPYDAHSVMHYKWGTVGSTELAFTELDKHYASLLYPWPSEP
jgi:hypothetical protein